MVMLQQQQGIQLEKILKKNMADGQQGPTADEKVQKCLGAAMNIANTIREIVESRQLTAVFWITA